MPLTLRIQDPDTGEETPLTLRDYEEITLADWKAFNPLDEDQSEDALFDNAIRKVCLYTGLPESTVGQWGSGVFSTVLGHVSAQLLRAFEGSDKFKKALGEGTDFVPESVILIGGVPYDVPLDMDKVSIAQFADWERWEPPTHEADIAAESCAFMLVPSGEDYQGPTKERLEAIMSMPMEQAFDLCAFFFSKSEPFVNVTRLRSRKFEGWTRRLLMATLPTSPSVTGDSTSSTGLLS